jgi:tetratricopeptide (TPR) repeat protein
MRAFVFTDPALERHAGQFVWLEINTEQAENAATREKFPVNALPSYLIVNPDSERVLLRWVGGASVAQLHGILDYGAATFANGGAGIDRALAEAEALYGDAKYGAAADAYAAVLAEAPNGWPAYGRVLFSRLTALQFSDRNAEGAKLADGALDGLGRQPEALEVAAGGLDCAVGMPKDAPDRRRLLDRFETAVRTLLADTTIAVEGDTRSGCYISLLDAREAAGDTAGYRAVAQQWSDALDAAAAAAKTPEERAVYDSHRLSAYIEIGHPERAVPMLEASEREFPDDYNPPARLAIAYKEMGRYDDALAACARARKLVYGPRTLRVMYTRADIQKAMGDLAAARATLEEAVRFAEALPPGQRSESTVAYYKRALESIDSKVQ